MSDEPDDLSPQEAAEAQALAARMDSLLSDESSSPPVPTDGDELAGNELEGDELAQLSAMIHAAHHDVALSSETQATIIEDALAAAVPAITRPRPAASVHSIGQARTRRKRAVYAGISTFVLAAAALLFWFRSRPAPAPEVAINMTTAITRSIPLHQQSRASDALVGQISKEESGSASHRLDQIYDNRLSGYRSLQYSRPAGQP